MQRKKLPPLFTSPSLVYSSPLAFLCQSLAVSQSTVSSSRLQWQFCFIICRKCSSWLQMSFDIVIFLPVWSQYLYSTMYRVPVRGIMLHHRSRQILFFAFHLEILYGKLWCAMHVPRQGGRESEREIESCQIRSDR